MTNSGKIWQLSLLSFIIAILTGFFYRAGMFYPITDYFSLANIRHAHSHLMFFNWISPPIMLYMIRRLFQYRYKIAESDLKKEIRAVHLCLYTMIFLGFLSYPFFLYYGYQSIAIGSAHLPIAAIISGFVMITWYWFAWIYLRNRSQCNADLPILFFDAALMALLISSLGAWGVSIFQFTEADSAMISSALTHFFLALFTEGWVLLGILGIIWNQAGSTDESIKSNWLWVPILFGAMLVFPFSLIQSFLPPLMIWSAGIGTFLIAFSLTINFVYLKKTGVFKGLIWKSIAVFLALKILFQFIALLPLDIWPGEHGLRVLYLHLVLLGFASSVLITVYNQKTQSIPVYMFLFTVWLVIISLIMISGYWPTVLQPNQIYFWIMIISILPSFPVMWIFWESFRKQSKGENPDSAPLL